jgi:phospholipase C
MKFIARSLLLLVLFGTPLAPLTAQSKGGPLKPVAFPSQIKHVVVIFQENRTPDNLFHFLSPQCTIPSGASGLAACTPAPVTKSCYDISPCGLSNQSGTPLPVTLTGVPLYGSTDPSHAHTAFEQMCDPDPANGYACRNDGAWNIKPVNDSYAYVENPAVTNYNGSPGHLLDPYLTYAEQYGWANYMFQTNQGPSFPAHQFGAHFRRGFCVHLHIGELHSDRRVGRMPGCSGRNQHAAFSSASRRHSLHRRQSF